MWLGKMLNSVCQCSYCAFSLHHSQTNDRRRQNSQRCVSILTGYPRSDRQRYVVRLLNQVDRYLDVAGDVHVYCDGDCSSLQTKFKHVAFHHLTTSQSPQRPLFQRLHNITETVQLSGVQFQRHRWLYVSQNYHRMLDDLFVAPNPTRSTAYQSCILLEDDLVLAPDALFYLNAVETLMQHDQTVFTGSLFSDNSYPLYARDPRRFRRVSHFSGLGFVMTQQRYIDEVRRTVWAGLQNWDQQVQKFLQRRALVSIIPEVTRALHLRRTSNSLPQFRPLHLFESQLLNKDVLPEYNLDHLQQSIYDRSIIDIVQRCQYIRYLADAMFFTNINDTVVYFGCEDDNDLHRVLVQKNLWGVGNGGVVRGSYRGVLFLRYYIAQVLIVCRSSEFYVHRRKARSIFRPNTENMTLDGRHVNRRVVGIIHRLNNDFTLAVATRNQSCDHACDRKCDITGLWLLNETCDVIIHVVPGCRRCVTASIDDYTDGVLPAMDVESDRCWRAYPHYISCETESDRYRRLCACRH